MHPAPHPRNTALATFRFSSGASTPSRLIITANAIFLLGINSNDVLVDNTPNDFVKGRDAQIEKAIEVLKAEIAAAPKKK